MNEITSTNTVKMGSTLQKDELQSPIGPESQSSSVPLRVGELTFEEDTSGGMGRHLGVFSTTFLIIGRIIGSGIFSTPSSITSSTGSVGAALLMWVLGFGISLSGLMVWLELGCLIPRSGGEKVYLEASYPRPRHLATIIFAVQSVLLGFSALSRNTSVHGAFWNDTQRITLTRDHFTATGCITFASNIAFAAGTELSDSAKRGIAASSMIAVVLMHGLTPTIGVKVMNLVGMMKIVILSFIVITGWVVLSGRVHKIPDPGASFHDAFKGSTNAANPYATALFKVLSSFAGWSNAAYVLNEVKNPVRTLKIAGPLALTTCGILYIMANVSYYAAATPKEVSKSGVTVAAFFMERVFGNTAARVLSVFVAFSALGNVMTVTYGHSRVNQEIAKEGVLPFGKFWASTWPCGAPTGGLFLHFIPSIIMITAVPFGDAYNFIIDVEGYPRAIVFLLAVIGMFVLRFSGPWKFLQRPFKAWWPVAAFFLVAQTFMLVVPFLRPPGGKGDTNQPYWVYPLVGIGVMLVACLYYLALVVIAPRVGNYKLGHDIVVLADGTHIRRFVRRKRE